MERHDLEQKLTPAARQVLDQLVSEYRSEILLRAGDSASELTGEVHEISVRDVVEGLTEAQSTVSARATGFLGSASGVYQVVGLTLAIAGLVLWFTSGGPYGLSYLERTFIWVLVLFGLGLAVLSKLAHRFAKKRVDQIHLEKPSRQRTGYAEGPSTFLSIWQHIELRLREMAATKFGESIADQPLSVLLHAFQREEVLDAETVERVQDLLILRNRIVHTRYDLSLADLQEVTYRARETLDRIQRELK